MITRWADTGFVPPANGVIVKASAFPAGFLTVNPHTFVFKVALWYNWIESHFKQR